MHVTTVRADGAGSGGVRPVKAEEGHARRVELSLSREEECVLADLAGEVDARDVHRNRFLLEEPHVFSSPRKKM